MIKIEKVDRSSVYFGRLTDYAKNCSWAAGNHLAALLENNAFTDWECAFAAVCDEQIIGFCTFMKTDYYPDNKYSPWISTVFVDEKHRGKRISGQMIETVIEYAKSCRFSAVYIPSDMTGFYEKYGFEKIDTLENYGGEIDNIYMKNI
ncbi:MAG: GNAT family N-acetyltransferase [Prevotella sp.]|nr:GNAT family N-acetyltransferase [Prevotella sp.]